MVVPGPCCNNHIHIEALRDPCDPFSQIPISNDAERLSGKLVYWIIQQTKDRALMPAPFAYCVGIIGQVRIERKHH